MIREFRQGDVNDAIKIYQKFYGDNFPFPDFFDKFICAFSIVEDGKLVLSGGVRTILEAVAVTDKHNPVRLRRDSLYQLLNACSYVATVKGYKEIHTSIQHDEKWEDQLKKVGFNEVNGKVLVLKI